MQPDIISVPVDVLNNGTAETQSFKRMTLDGPNKTTYVGPGHSVIAPNLVTLYRTPAKRSGNYLGSSKSAIKLSETISVNSVDGQQIPAALICECSFSVPVGATAAQTLALRQKMIAWLDSAYATSLVDVLEI